MESNRKVLPSNKIKKSQKHTDPEFWRYRKLGRIGAEVVKKTVGSHFPIIPTAKVVTGSAQKFGVHIFERTIC